MFLLKINEIFFFRKTAALFIVLNWLIKKTVPWECHGIVTVITRIVIEVKLELRCEVLLCLLFPGLGCTMYNQADIRHDVHIHILPSARSNGKTVKHVLITKEDQPLVVHLPESIHLRASFSFLTREQTK